MLSRNSMMMSESLADLTAVLSSTIPMSTAFTHIPGGAFWTVG